MLRKYVIYPILWGIFPVVYLYANNVDQVKIYEIFRSLIAFTLFTVLIFLLFRFILRDWHRAGMMTTLALLLFFSFGHLQLYLTTTFPEDPWLFRKRTLAILYAGFFVVFGTLITFRLLKPSRWTPILNAVSIMLLLYNNFFIIQYFGNLLITSNKKSPVAVAQQKIQPHLSQKHLSSPPDIYYIILDGYGQPDMLNKLYELDDSMLVDFLKSQGFVVAEKSHSNYIQTALSLSSSLNMNYVDQLIPVDPASRNRTPLSSLIKESALRSFLHDQGYKMIAFATGYEMT